MREVLASEMLEALGVPTSRSFSLIETGEALERNDEPSPTRSAVLVRLSHGHIRIGTFQRLAHLRDADAMRRLVAYTLGRLFGEPGDDPVRLLHLVVERTARLAARYMAAGFVHGVLNSDNINVTGESFDYGPWRFAPTWDPAFVAAYFDHAGLYAFGRQPEAIHWDVMQLAVSLRLLVEAAPLIEALDGFGAAYQPQVAEAMLWRMGRRPRAADEDRALVQTVERAMRASGVAIDGFFHDVFARDLPVSYGEDWAEVRAAIAPFPLRRARDHAIWNGAPVGMAIEEVETIWRAIDTADDWRPFAAKIESVRALGQALSD